MPEVQCKHSNINMVLHVDLHQHYTNVLHQVMLLLLLLGLHNIKPSNMPVVEQSLQLGHLQLELPCSMSCSSIGSRALLISNQCSMAKLDPIHLLQDKRGKLHEDSLVLQGLLNKECCMVPRQQKQQQL